MARPLVITAVTIACLCVLSEASRVNPLVLNMRNFQEGIARRTKRDVRMPSQLEKMGEQFLSVLNENIAKMDPESPSVARALDPVPMSASPFTSRSVIIPLLRGIKKFIDGDMELMMPSVMSSGLRPPGDDQ